MVWTKENGSTGVIAGITKWQGAWATSTAYKIGDGVQNDGSSYVCIAEHTSGATTEPGTGASWETYWSLLASKGDAGSGATDTDAIHDNADGEISAISAKSALVNDDIFLIEDSEASNAKKKTLFSSIKSVLKTYFDTLYAATLGADDNYVTDAEKTVIGNTSGTNTGDETTTTLGSKINGATAKSTPIDADIVGYVDTEASNVIKKATWTNIKAFLKTYFDTIYQAALGFTAENSANKKTDLTDNSDTYYPSQKAVKTAVDGKMTNPMTTQGDIVYGGASGAPTRLAKGTSGQVLKMNSGETAPEWGSVSGGGDVLGPASNTDNYIPQWNGADSKTLKDGLAVPAGGLAGLTALGDKVDKVAGKGLSTEDYTSAEKTKLSGVATGATADSKATGAELDTGTDDAKFATAKALKDSGYLSGMGDISAASDSVAGKVELATVSETNTGTDTGRAITPDGLAGSNFGIRYVQITCFEYATDVATGDGKGYLIIPAALNGMNLVSVHAKVITAGTTGTTDIQIANVTDSVDMLSTKLTIDSGETGSDTAATAAVIDTTKDDVATNDLLRIDVDAKSTTAPKGLIVTLGFQLP